MSDFKVGGANQWVQQRVDHLKQKEAASAAEPAIGKALEQLEADGGFWNPPADIKERFPRLGEHIHKIDIFGSHPKTDIDALRETRGAKQTELLLDFQNKLDKMSRSELQQAQSYLVDLMADPGNKDDELLGALLKTVNKELNARSSFHIDPSPRPYPRTLEKIDLNDPRFQHMTD